MKFAHFPKLSLLRITPEIRTTSPSCCAFTPALKGWVEIGRGDPNDDLPPGVGGHVGHLRKMFVSFATQLFSRGALVGR